MPHFLHLEAGIDDTQERWVERLRPEHPRRDETVAALRDVLVRAAFSELARRRGQLGWIRGPEFDDLAHQAANDALMRLLARLDDFRGLSRFTTWAYKFVIVEVSSKVARHAWRRQPPGHPAPALEHLADSLAPGPGDRLEQHERLAALSAAIRELTGRQRDVFVAIALNDVPIDVLAIRLGTNRNALYKEPVRRQAEPAREALRRRTSSRWDGRGLIAAE